MSRRFPILAAVPAGWLILFLAAPAVALGIRSLDPDALRVLAAASTWRLLGRTFGIAAAATAACLLLSFPAAVCIAASPPRRRNFLLFLVVLPFWTNLLVRTYALMFVLRPAGFLFTPAAVILGMVHSFLPFMILPLVVSLERVPRTLVEAARDLGATPAEAFWKVTLPLARPGIVAGCLLVFVPALGIFALPEFIGGASVPMVGSQITHYFLRAGDAAAGSALTLILLALTTVLTGTRFLGRRPEGPA